LIGRRCSRAASEVLHSFPAVVGKIAAAMPGAEEVVFAGAAHTPHVSHPAEFIETISEFVRRHESRLRERVGL
jgi:pimeloyl-ACP methyl ester carboxylesterase